MAQNFNFNDLFVYDLANNHQGDIAHGIRIIDEISTISNAHGVAGVIKFQFRQLDSFLHPQLKATSTNKNITRFLSTRLARDDFDAMLAKARKHKLLTMCTPFDEESVDIIVDMNFDIIKIASCSSTDWPLIETIAAAGKPVIFSTGGLQISDIDDLVSFFDHRGVEFAIMHCVSIYPTPNELCNLSVIETLTSRYPGKVIGWSTHENPDETAPIQVAYAKGARLFERHVGIETDTIKLNAYSSTPQQIDRWLSAYRTAKDLCGSPDRGPTPEVEAKAIAELRRGVFARRKIVGGTVIDRDDVYFAMPWSEGQLASSEWKDGIVAKGDISPDESLTQNLVDMPSSPKTMVIKKAIHQVKALLNEARVTLNSEFEVEYSHHYGVENFRETGAVLITCINRSYSKKVIVQLPGQHHPSHFHRHKEETFQILHGILHAKVDGHDRRMAPGETVTILPGVFHEFWTDTGVVFEEIASTDTGDSFYRDPNINKMQRSERKTRVDHWGRYQV